MRRQTRRSSLLLLILLTLSSCLAGRDVGPVVDETQQRRNANRDTTAPADLIVGTFNIRQLSYDEPMRGWEDRRALVVEAVRREHPDITAFQEVLTHSHEFPPPDLRQLEYLTQEFPGYGFALAGDPNEMPTENPVMYRRDRFELIDEGWSSLSPTPDVLYAPGWDGRSRLNSGWVLLRDVQAHVTLLVVNLHFHSTSDSSRRQAAELVRNLIDRKRHRADQVLVFGDFNALPESAPVRQVAGNDLRHAITGRWPGSYHGGMGVTIWPRIDHILISAGFAVLQEGLSYFRGQDGTWPSDHYPVFARLQYQ